ncbi:uncharacterized protein [Misgurnus anguillicaudatus]|uniref:uncharacterized protein n=1 Tax=Misgurnus anguillicaudatus TaxID=75329 RepID=UPI003CCF4117
MCSLCLICPDVRLNNIMSPSARGFVTSSGVCDGRRKSNISTQAAGHVNLPLPGAVDDEECSRAAVRQNTILSTSACGLVTGSSARDVRQRSNSSTPAASQGSITPPRAAKKEERRKKKADKKPKQPKGKSIRAFFRRTVQAIQHACCICQNEDDLESSDSDDPQPGPSNLLSSTREDPTDLQKGPSGLKHTGFQEPAYCLAGSFTLEKTEIQEETDRNQGLFDPAELRAQPDQAFCKPGPFGPHGAREQDSPFGLERACHEEPAYCLAGSFSLEKTEIQEETDHNQGPFDPAELRAQPDQAFCKPGPSGLHGAREQNSPFGLEQASHEEPDYCQSGSFTLETTEIQEETDLEHGPFDPEPSAQSDQPGPSALNTARKFSLLYEVGKWIGRGVFGDVHAGTQKSDGRKVAIKFIDKSKHCDRFITMHGHAKPLCSEVAINLMLLKPEKSPCIVEMLDWFEEEDRRIIVLEFPEPCISLFDFVEMNEEDLSEVQARHFMRQAVVAVMHCIDRGVYHADIKLENFLVKTDTMELKLIDFGVSLIMPSYSSVRRMAIADMVADLGILLFKLLPRPSPFDKNAVISDACKDLLHRCMDLNPDRRPTLEEILQHKWFDEG